ncbi:flagellar protein FlaG [Methylovorus mays]|uniref:flagellar protein FlaG n=1 Tax=Methylovorus mays TaxID=184077 RepID=UPI001E421F49|nr:flagellar protein FlaG [Methylovorus mays]MCB5207510.1 flagellar protein FlaG [Methylovorus mays]
MMSTLSIQAYSAVSSALKVSDGTKSSQATSAANVSKTSEVSTAKAAEPSASELDTAVDSINDFISAVANNLEFSVDRDTERVVVKVVDKETHEVVKQFPSEEALAISKALDKLQGLMVKQTA